ncbi:PALP-domain-containing protein [Rickenella mellea]|uniref:cysteine synthase n=1 Tax=Rickenella mellea TaxID=50990 RepID=A0A4Y7QEB4_9AGAM|nr:PALP-domain-containing protein [Rickenella mellea]
MWWPDWPILGIRSPFSHSRNFFVGLFLGFSLSFSSVAVKQLYNLIKREKPPPLFNPRPIELRSDEIVRGVVGLIGNTPLIRITSLSDALGVEILGKAEFLNPGGSVKDRVALRMIDDAERQGLIRPNSESRIFEGTVGSTGISIATVARARGYATTIIIPDDVAEEKAKALIALGSQVERVRPASIVDKKQFVNVAKLRASEYGRSDLVTGAGPSTVPQTVASQSDATTHVHPKEHSDSKGFFADQFENTSNYDAHFDGTGPELWRQTNGHIDAFVSGAGTGGTIAGVGQFLKTMDENVKVVLADPEGSGLFNKVKYGVMFDPKESEGTKRRHQVDTVVEGIGINRLTKNMELALPIIDDAFRVSDVEAVAMSRYLVMKDGLFVGSSSACNLFACIKLVKKLGLHNGETIVTILCDSGNRHYSKVRFFIVFFLH